MKYRNIAFDDFPLLRQFVSFIYEIKTLDNECTYRTIPNGKIGISIITDGNAHILRGNSWDQIPGATIYGLTRQTQLIKLSRQFREIAIGFNPVFLQLFVDESMSCFSGGKTIDIRSVFDNREVSDLTEKMHAADSDQPILLALASFLNGQLKPEKENKSLFSALSMITNEKNYTVHDVSHRINVSTTTLRNLFRDFVGISPKGLIRTMRITEALNYRIASDENLTDLAYRSGYFDQSHFIHDFKEVLGITPKQYYKNKDLAFDFYNFGRWTSGSFDAKSKNK
ncbi:MAG: transcriptional regulator, AraC family [Bacteroidetes bacterium]|nr:transcriptional regulator, AraC family [Bacteroidota bacterium]